jgi:hypothetical protein
LVDGAIVTTLTSTIRYGPNITPVARPIR